MCAEEGVEFDTVCRRRAERLRVVSVSFSVGDDQTEPRGECNRGEVREINGKEGEGDLGKE